MEEITYPYKKYNFRVVIDQKEEAGFSEVSAPGLSSDPIEYREGPITSQAAKKQPGIVKYENVTLKRGSTESRAFADWMKEIQNGKADRKTVLITLFNDEMEEVASWHLEKAWPTKYSAPDFDAATDEIAIETLELVTEGIMRVK